MKTYLKRCPSPLLALLFLATNLFLLPTRALADVYRWAEDVVVDKQDFYEPEEDGLLPQASSVAPRDISYEMLYFCEYESGLNYDEGLGAGDGYHAMGAFQFDNRYELGEFISACYHYNPSRYHMFAQFEGRDLSVSLHDGGGFTELGAALNAAWHAAYAANPTEFSQLQNGYAYDNYYSLARNFLLSKGVNIDARADCVKGLCWGMCNLFGPGGWQWFFNGSGANAGMSDRDFVTTLATYVAFNVSYRYPNQQIYWKGWQNRYRHELVDCLNYLDAASPYDPNVTPMQRMYNSNSGEHFYTGSTSERNSLIISGWRYEGIGWKAPANSGSPVYRLYSGTDHHYTTNESERNHLVNLGWRLEGVGWLSGGDVPLYRQYNPHVNPKAPTNNSGSHNYTTSKQENDHLVSVGWRSEGIGWYGLA